MGFGARDETLPAAGDAETCVKATVEFPAHIEGPCDLLAKAGSCGKDGLSG